MAGFVASWLGTAVAGPADDARIAHARALHDRGVTGDKQAVVECIRELEAMLGKDPGFQLARVYLGSACTLRSRDLFPGPDKLRTLRRGGELMDAAVAAAPKDLQVRLVRAVNNMSLPAIFGRRPVAREDFRILLAEVRRGGHGLRREEVQAIHLFAGLDLDRAGESIAAHELWRKGLSLDSQSELGHKMARLLDG